MATATKPKPPHGEKNTYNLPRGDRLRRELRSVFASQRRAILRYLATGRKGHATGPLPATWPDWHDFGTGTLTLAERMAPLLSLTWDAAGSQFLSRIGLDPDRWDVTNPHLARQVDEAALAFCGSTNATTSKRLDVALAETREALHQGVVKEGESVEVLTKRINAIFDGAEKYRARAIAQTETSRAVHAAQEAAAVQSGVVTGWTWLLSGDACPICVAIAARAPAVRLGHAFAVIGDNPHYSQVKFPPAHPHCNCTVQEVLDTDPQPAWSDTLHQPKPATDEEWEAVASAAEARDAAILAGKPPKPAPTRPKPPVKPPAARKPAKPPRPPAATKPTPPPTSPAQPAWKPGTPIDAGRPIGERIAGAAHLDAKVQAIAGLDAGGRSQAEIDALQDRRNALADEIRAYLAGPGANRSVLDPDHQAALHAFDRRERELLDRMTAIRDAEQARIRSELEALLGVAPGEQAAWTHTDGSGFKPRSKNAANRKEAADWLASKLVAGPGAAPIDVRWESKPRVRAYASRDRKMIMVKKDEPPAIMVHELGHHVEFAIPGAEQAAREFLMHRVGNQALRRLRDVVPNSGYDPTEMGRDDEFAKAFGDRKAWYVGKHYHSGSTEILSMGLELLYNSPVHFAKNDPEYCKFILGILDGSLRSP